MFAVKYGDEVDRKHHGKRRKRSNSDDDGSSDGERTLELASSHSSDEDEATTVHGPVRSATLGIFFNTCITRIYNFPVASLHTHSTISLLGIHNTFSNHGKKGNFSVCN